MHQVIRPDGKAEIKPNSRLVCDLIFERNDKKRVYPSFPISQVGHLPTVVHSIIEFRERLRDHFIVFDPYDITEGGLLKRIKAAQAEGNVDNGCVKVGCRAGDLFISEDEVALAGKAIWAQIRSRDFRLIDQSDFVCAYLPERDDGSAYQSWGVMAELNYAHNTGRHTYAECTAKDVAGPFADTLTRIFPSWDDALAHFDQLTWI